MNKLQKILKIKGIGFILLAFVAGVILLLYPQGKESKSTEVAPSALYASSLESQLESILRDATGSKCRVMITFDGGYSYSYATNETLDTVYSGGEVASKNVTKEYVIVSKDGEEALALLKENLPSVKGVAVVCSGGEGERNAVVSIVKALFQLPNEAICCVAG